MSVSVILPTLNAAGEIAALLFLLKNRTRPSAQPPRRSVCEAAGRAHSLFSQSLEGHARCATAERSVRRVASAYGP